MLEYYPYLYYLGQRNVIYTVWSTIWWLCYSFFVGLIIFIISYYSMLPSIVDESGHNPDIWFFSITVYTTIVFVVDFKLVVIIKTWNWFTVISLTLFSTFLYIGFVWLSNYMPTYFYTVYTANIIFGSPLFYF